MKLHDWNQVAAEQMNPQISRKVLHGSNLTIARLEIRKDAVVPEHHHINEQVATVERGALKFTIAGREQILRAGESVVLAPNEPHSVVALEDTVVVDVFSPAREDWLRGEDAYLRK